MAQRVSPKERRLKYDEKARRWKAKPTIDSCPAQDWHIEDGASYQSQLFCQEYQTWINPSGFTCQLCREHNWPEIERWRHHSLPDLIATKGKKAAGDAVVEAVERRTLSEKEATVLVRDFDLG